MLDRLSSLHSRSVLFFQFYKLSRSQNGFGGALLFKLARGVDGHLGVVSRRQRRDPWHRLPAKVHENRIVAAGLLAFRQSHSLTGLKENQRAAQQRVKSQKAQGDRQFSAAHLHRHSVCRQAGGGAE